MIKQIEEQFNKVKQSRSEMQGRVQLLKEQKKKSNKDIKAFTHQYNINEKVLDILRQYAVLKEQSLREKIDKVVTRGLQLIFGSGYKSKLEFGIQRGQAVIKPKIISEVNGIELETDIAEAHGGGIVNICAFLYNVLVLALVRPRQLQILFLDEPFRNVSEEYLEATAMFLKEISEKLDMQIVLITHRQELFDIGDVRYYFRLEDGITQIKEIGNE